MIAPRSGILHANLGKILWSSCADETCSKVFCEHDSLYRPALAACREFKWSHTGHLCCSSLGDGGLSNLLPRHSKVRLGSTGLQPGTRWSISTRKPKQLSDSAWFNMQIAPMASSAHRLSVRPACHLPASQITVPRRSLRKQLVCQAKHTEKVEGSSVVDGAPNVASSASALATFGLLTPFLLDVHSASAHDPLLTGRYISLVHPAMMAFLFGATAYTGWLGLQWR